MDYNSNIEQMDYNLNIHNNSVPKKINQDILLEGLLHMCRFPQLSILSDKIKKLNRIDFFKDLPQEVSLQILSYLDAISLCKAAQVSKKWQELADDNAVWKRICMQHIDKKCNKCGWGLPLLENQHESNNEREDDNNNRTIIWKQIYSRRLVIERNWRKGRYSVKVLEGHSDGITCLQLKKDILITGSYDATVRIWSIETGETLSVLSGHTSSVKALQFDDSMLATASLDCTIKLWNYKKGTCIRTLRGHTDSVISLHFIKGVLASGSADKTIKVWNSSSGQHYTLIGHTDCVNRVIIYKETQILSSSDDGSLDNTLKVWCAQSGKCCSTLFGHVEGIWALALNSLRMVTGSQDKTVKIWDKNTGVCLHTLKGHEDSVTCIALSDTKVVTGSDDKTIRIWDFNV
ncbi:12057_t:CDS:2 [Entrophospora sp. SA101]|nr:12057_t:CDS:2 [Entrophospora sp. SA101]